MNKEQQIKKMAKIVDKMYKRYTTTAEDIAERLYNAGYRKIDEVQKETAKEILQYVGDLYDDCDERFRLKDYQWHEDMCKKYGVEVKK